MTTTPSIERHLPGAPSCSSDGKVDYRPGTVGSATERMQFIDMKHPEHKRVILLGSTYVYWCSSCQRTVYEHDVTAFGSVVQGGFRGTTNIRVCPFCATWGPTGHPIDGTQLSWVKVGTKLRLHYRSGAAPKHCTCGHKTGDHTNGQYRCSMPGCECDGFVVDETAPPLIIGEWWAEVVPG